MGRCFSGKFPAPQRSESVILVAGKRERNDDDRRRRFLRETEQGLPGHEKGQKPRDYDLEAHAVVVD